MPWPNGRVADTILREMEAHRKRLGAQLLDLRKARGWNQEDAAHEVGVGVKTWRLWERGKTMPYDSNIRKISEVFGIDPDELGQHRPAPLGLITDASGMDTPDLLAQINGENQLAEILAQLLAVSKQNAAAAERHARAVEQQNELLERQTVILERIEGRLDADNDVADEIKTASGALDQSAARLDAAVQKTIAGLRAAPAPKKPKARKSAPRPTPRP